MYLKFSLSILQLMPNADLIINTITSITYFVYNKIIYVIIQVFALLFVLYAVKTIISKQKNKSSVSQETKPQNCIPLFSSIIASLFM